MPPSANASYAGSLFILPLKGGGRRRKAQGGGPLSQEMVQDLTKSAPRQDPHPNPPPFRGRELTSRVSIKERFSFQGMDCRVKRGNDGGGSHFYRGQL